MRSLFIVIAIGTGAFLLSQCIQRSNEPSGDLIHYDHTEGYIGAEACRSCHAEAYELWEGSHHDWAMKIATDETVFGNFNDHKITLDGVDYHFYQEGEAYRIHVTEINGTIETYTIDHTFGVTPLQQYITSFDKGKKQVLRASWDTDSNRWYHQYPEQELHPNDWLHWSEGGQRWNTMCAECHSTNLKRNYFPDVDSFHTTWSSINVSCEGCHGPARQHVEWAEKNKDKKHKGGNYYILNARDQQAQIDQCAPCHSRRSRLTTDYEHDGTFEDQFILQTVTPEFYHPDGQIEDEDYVIGSFLQSKMFLNGVKCNDCHDAHSMQLKKTGNDLCMSCHEPEYNTAAHHFHQVDTESAECVSCHMTGAVYMGNDFRRDHSFRIPRPDQSIEYGTPNACTGCHSDKPDTWAAENIVTWYGDKRPEHFSDALLLTTKGQLTAEEQQKIRAFITDKKQSFLTRATAIDNYTFAYSPVDFQTLLSASKDSAALVRYKALMKFMELPPEERFAIGLENLNDPSRMVRIAAAQLVVEVDADQMTTGQREIYNAAIIELETMLFSSADFPVGRLQLGDYYFRKNQLNKAIKQYVIALQMDSLLVPVYPNLATAYSRAGKNAASMETLDKLIHLEPGLARAYYLRALLFNELKNSPSAIKDFNKAMQLDPLDFRSRYNLSILYYQLNAYKKAEKAILEALQILPQSDEAKYMLALIYQEQGREAEAKKIMDELQ
ncbi:MAG: tetratricopeptide repeat protein [Bacteroidetes bacterium]|nr:tetratricopeptide repeat protein [Bacteroidota bacterium]